MHGLDDLNAPRQPGMVPKGRGDILRMREIMAEAKDSRPTARDKGTQTFVLL